jgi:RNA polymerase sigma-70 factor (ECF subfamily)
MALSPRHHQPPLSAEATSHLVAQARAGNVDALDHLLQRLLPLLRRWADGRVPPSVRAVYETDDVVQDAVVETLSKLDLSEARHVGALGPLLRQAVTNRIHETIRLHQKSRPGELETAEAMADDGPSPLEQAIRAENVARYERALARLSPVDREAIIGRIELQHSYEELAIMLRKPTAAAARKAVARAIERLVSEVARD